VYYKKLSGDISIPIACAAAPVKNTADMNGHTADVVEAVDVLSRRCSLHGNMTEHKNTDVFKDYESVEVLGIGTMGSVTLVKKKAVGGSARSPLRKVKRLPYDPPTENADLPNSAPDSLHQRRHLRIPSDFTYEVMYALKTIHFSRLQDEKFIQELRNEIDILKSLDHPNIVRAIETFEYKGQICFLMDVCTGGDLYTRDPYTEDQARRIVKKLTSAIEYMHRHGVVHRGRRCCKFFGFFHFLILLVLPFTYFLTLQSHPRYFFLTLLSFEFIALIFKT
jgi:hypothetical protein